jgi:uncharacterized membrane-anchored protein
MPSLQTLLLDTKRVALNRSEILYEIHYRVPRRLSAPFLASHFTQIRRSPEDKDYEQARKLALDYFDPSKDALRPIFAPRHEFWEGVFREKTQSSDFFRYDPQVVPNQAALDQATFCSTATDISLHIQLQYMQVLTTKTGLFIFGAEEHILDWVARRVTDKYGDDRILDLVFKKLCREFEIEFKNIRAIISQEFRKDVRAFEAQYESPDYGSVRFWLNERRHIQAQGSFGEPFDDFRHYEAPDTSAPESPLRDLKHEIRWSRFPQAWNYTFIEFPRSEATCKPEVRADFLLSWILDPSVVNSIRFPDNIPGNLHFPGKTLAGAHYFMLAVDDLIWFSVCLPSDMGLDTNRRFDGDKIVERVGRLRIDIKIEDQKTRQAASTIAGSLTLLHKHRCEAAKRLLDCCLQFIGAVENEKFQRSLSENLQHILTILFVTPSGGRPWHQASRDIANNIVDRLSQDTESDGIDKDQRYQIRKVAGLLVRFSIENPTVSKAKRRVILGAVAELAKALWNSTVSATINTDLSTVAEDFVSSSMVGGRCVYFSNFLPLSREEFTRTMFVDVGMNDHQRARVLQRMNDILSYRSISIRDLDRVRTAIEALNDITRKLNGIQMRLDNHPIEAGGTQVIERPRKLSSIQDLRSELDKIIDVSTEMGRINGFFTYGIAGRCASTNAYYEQILERCEDLREDRLPGYPLIADFVKRRLKHSIRYVERLDVLSASMGQRVSELLDRVRTNLEALQTLAMQRDIRRQVNLTSVGEVIIVVGGSYYVYRLAQAFNRADWFEPSKVADWKVATFGIGVMICCLIILKFRLRDPDQSRLGEIWKQFNGNATGKGRGRRGLSFMWRRRR